MCNAHGGLGGAAEGGEGNGSRTSTLQPKGCGLGHKHQQSAYDVCATYLHGGFGPVVATQCSEANLLWVFKLSAHSLLNDPLYSPCSMLYAWKMCPQKCGGGQAGVGGAGGEGAVQDPTNM